MLAARQRPSLRLKIADSATFRAKLLAEKGDQVGIATGNPNAGKARLAEAM